MNRPSINEHADGEYAIEGDLTFSSVTQLLSESSASIRNGSGAMVFDLAQVARTDSAGLVLLIEWMREAESVGRELRYRNLPQQMLDIARVSDLDELLPLAE